MMVGGTGTLDLAVLEALYSAHKPAVRAFATFVTVFGEWQAVILLSIIAGGWLLYRKHLRTAVLLLAITLIGRILVELQKFGIHRLRPTATEHLVPVQSLSFPSAHAANSMLLPVLVRRSVGGSQRPRYWRLREFSVTPLCPQQLRCSSRAGWTASPIAWKS